MQRDISEGLLLLRLQKQLGILLLSLSSNVEVISSLLEAGRVFSRDDPELSGEADTALTFRDAAWVSQALSLLLCQAAGLIPAKGMSPSLRL